MQWGMHSDGRGRFRDRFKSRIGGLPEPRGPGRVLDLDSVRCLCLNYKPDDSLVTGGLKEPKVGRSPRRALSLGPTSTEQAEMTDYHTPLLCVRKCAATEKRNPTDRQCKKRRYNWGKEGVIPPADEFRFITRRILSVRGGGVQQLCCVEKSQCHREPMAGVFVRALKAEP